MKSYTTLRNLYGSLTNDTSSTNLTLGDQLLNDSHRHIVSLRDWDFMQRSATQSTVASQQFYDLPYNYRKLIYVTITVGSTVYTPKEAPTREFWDWLNQNTSITSNVPNWFFIFNGQIGFYPIPSGSTGTIRVVYNPLVKDLSFADFTTGTVDVITNASTSVTGSATSWTTPMAGRWLRVTPSNTATANGDGFWYEIESVTNSTTLVLEKAYQGTSLTTGAAAAYIIGQMPLLPEAFHDLPVYKACEIYFQSVQADLQRSMKFQNLYNQGLANMIAIHGSKSQNPAIDENFEIVNPNLSVFL